LHEKPCFRRRSRAAVITFAGVMSVNRPGVPTPIGELSY